MDPRVLLNPKLLKKKNNQEESTKNPSRKTTTNPRSSTQSSTSTSPHRIQTSQSAKSDSSTNLKTSPHTIRTYDPRALLNPRGPSQLSRLNPSDSSPSPSKPNMSSYDGAVANSSLTANGYSEFSPVAQHELTTSLAASRTAEAHPSQSVNSEQREGPSKRFLENLYGVEARTEQPVKKVKVQHKGEIDRKSGHSFQHKSSGVIGEYMNQKTQDQIKPPTSNCIVDLTNDDDDDLEITGSWSRDSEVVCLGKLFLTFDAYLCPKPKKKAAYISDSQWPHITCTTIRKPENRNNSVINVLDPFDREFAKIHPDQAHVLAKAMDAFQDFRLQAFLVPREKKHEDWPHAPCSYSVKASTNFYCRRGDVERVGKYFGQNNLFFTTPTMPDKDVDIVNPHKQYKNSLQRKLAGPNGHGQVLPDTRTNEEVAQQMVNMIDEWSKKQERELPETEAPATIATGLLPHQKQALSFMLGRESPRTYDDDSESLSLSLWRKKVSSTKGTVYEDLVSGIRVTNEPDQVLGGLLADVMGLGKTLEALALVASTVDASEEFGKQRPIRGDPKDADIMSHTKSTLIICPTSTVQNWDNQIKEHLNTEKLAYYIYHGQKRTTNVFDLKKYDIVITTYGTVASDARSKPSLLEQLKWFRIILDEAHTIREQKAQQSIACYTLSAQRRWCLTGTPIQNRIGDLGSLTKFLQLYPYSETSYFNQYIGSKTVAADESYLDKLRLFVDSFCLRRTREKIDLPDRKDLISILTFSEAERRMHDHFKEKAKVRIEAIIDSDNKKSGVHLHMLKGITTLRLICAHGRDLLKEKDLKELRGMTAADAIDLDRDDESVPTIKQREAYENFNLMAEADQDFCHACDTKLTGESPQANGIDDSGVRCYVLPCMDTICSSCFGQEKEFFETVGNRDRIECPFCGLNIAPQYIPIDASMTDVLMLPDDAPEETEENKLTKYTGPKTKAKALLQDVAKIKEESKMLKEKGEKPLKCVVFSEFTSNLSLIERALSATGYTFARIDGSMSLSARRKVLDAFDTDDEVTILLASIKAAGQGLNLTAASRAFIMEPMWNPAAEAQAVDRIYRIGQKRDVIIKRYQIEDSIEMKIVELARKKMVLASAALGGGEQQQKKSKKEQRLQNLEDIKSLFK